MAAQSNVRCWSRNLSARRHRELERMNEMEKRRQFLEIRKQNDLFKQISSTISTTSTCLKPESSANGSTTPTIETNEQSKSSQNSCATASASSSGQGTITKDTDKLRNSAKDHHSNSDASGDKTNTLTSSSELQSVGNNDRKNLSDQTDSSEPNNQPVASVANLSLARSAQQQRDDRVEQESDIVQLSTGSKTETRDQTTPNGIESHPVQKLEILTQDQMDLFVSTCVPRNKRVLCLIVRDKLSRLHQSKSYFYPIYYLFIQAIVDVSDGCSYYPENLTYCQEDNLANDCASGGGGGGGEQSNVDALVDNSFSASSSISADMMFIGNGAGNETTELGQNGHGNVKLSGTSYSDNELCDDNTYGEGQLIAETHLLKGSTRAVDGASLSPLGGHVVSKPLDESLVYPSGRSQSTTSGRGDVLAKGASEDKFHNRLELASVLMKSKLGRSEKNRKAASEEEIDEAELDEDEDEDDDNDSESDLHQIDAKDQDAPRDRVDVNQSDRASLAKRYNCSSSQLQQQQPNEGVKFTSQSIAQKQADCVPRTQATGDSFRATSSANLVVARLFENNRNPHVGTCGVVLSGKRRKKTKTYLIGLGEDGFMRKNSICKLKSNVLGTQFSATRSLSIPEKNIIVDRCTIASINYETNVLGFKGPRKMRVFLSKDLKKPFKNLSEAYKRDSNSIAQLKNMVPSWNAESQSYVLNFHGRVTQASVKNFQLIESRDHTNMDQINRERTHTPMRFDPNSDKERKSDGSSRQDTRSSQSNGSLKMSSERGAFMVEPEEQWYTNEDSPTEGCSSDITSNPFNQPRNNNANYTMDKIIHGHKNLAYNSSIVMQFGRISTHEFTCDVMYPLSILQAFTIALSSFDSKLACE